MANIFDAQVLQLIDDLGISIDKLNDLAAAIQKLGYNTEESAIQMEKLMSAIASGQDLDNAIETVFGITKGSSEYATIIKALEKAIGTGALNMGQNIKALKSQINSFYETVSK